MGGRKYFDKVEVRKYFVEPHIQGFAEFERERGKKVLEIGCGIGTNTVNFAVSNPPSHTNESGGSRRLEMFLKSREPSQTRRLRKGLVASGLSPVSDSGISAAQF